MVDGGGQICPLILSPPCLCSVQFATALYILTIQRSCLFQESQFTFLQLLKDNCLSVCSAVPYNNVAVSAESSERDGDEASVSSTTPTSPRTRSSVRVLRTNMFSRAHAFQTFLHLVSLTLSYLLMLIAMTFNSWLFGSVVGGLAAG